jgi:hypothetical protein
VFVLVAEVVKVDNDLELVVLDEQGLVFEVEKTVQAGNDLEPVVVVVDSFVGAFEVDNFVVAVVDKDLEHVVVVDNFVMLLAVVDMQ